MPADEPEVIDIGVSQEDIAARRQRFLSAFARRATERAPVLPSIASRYLLDKLGVLCTDFFEDPRTHLHARIYGAKWLLENIRTDQFWVDAFPDFMNVREAGSLGCDVIFPTDDMPWVRGAWVRTDDDLRRLQDMEYLASGLRAREREFAEAFREMASEFPMRFQGGAVFYPAKHARPALMGSDGPFTLACELRGMTALMEDLILRPDFAHRLLRSVTDKILEAMREGMKHSGGSAFLGDDMAMNLSPRMFREFVAPYDAEILNAMPGVKTFHMCGDTNHLLEVISDELPITFFHGLGHVVDRDRAAECLASKMTVAGNVNPITLLSGTPDEVRADACDAIERLGRYGSLILMDGNNVPPGAPVENINAMYDAAERG